MAANIPKLRLLVGGAVIEGAQVTLEDLPRAEQGGACELVRFLGGAKRVLILHKPVIHRNTKQVHPQYLVIRQDLIQTCEFTTPDTAEAKDVTRNVFRWEWDD